MSDLRILGKYRLVAELARGGMGVVYLAVTSGLGGFSKLVVVKELKPELVEDAGFLEMFLEEARLAAHLNHPNVVPTYEVDIDGKRPFIVMEYLDGQTLARIIRKKLDGFTLHMQLRVLLHALDGLQYAHRREQFDGTTISVVHRDVSPQNIFVTYDGQVKVVDFGIAKASDTTVETRTGVFKGKPSYMAPEQLNGEVDPLADVFAVGVILWEALSGRRMWKRRNDVEVLTLLIKGDIPSIDEAAPDAPEELRRIVKKGVAVDRKERYQSAREIRDDIERYLESIGDRTSLKEIGVLVGQAFAEQRERLRTIIERCISESKEASAANRAKLPSIAASEEVSPMSAAMSVGGLSAVESLAALAAQSRGPSSTSSSGPPTPNNFRGLGQTMRMDPTPVPPLTVPPSVNTGTGTTGGTPQGSTLDFSSGEPRSQRRLGILPFVAAGGLGVFGLLIIILVLTMGRKRHLETPAAAEAPPTAEVASAPTEPTETAVAPTATVLPAATTIPTSTTVATAPPAPTPTPTVADNASTNAKPPAAVVRPTWTHVAPARAGTPRPAQSVTAAPVPAPSPSPTTNCNPPFYYEGTKKVFKAGCL